MTQTLSDIISQWLATKSFSVPGAEVKFELNQPHCFISLSNTLQNDKILANITISGKLVKRLNDFQQTNAIAVYADHVYCYGFDYEVYTLDDIKCVAGEPKSINAADPKFFDELERNIREHINYLQTNNRH